MPAILLEGPSSGSIGPLKQPQGVSSLARNEENSWRLRLGIRGKSKKARQAGSCLLLLNAVVVIFSVSQSHCCSEKLTFFCWFSVLFLVFHNIVAVF